MNNEFNFQTDGDLPMVSEKIAEDLARAACENYMTKCNLQDTEQAKLAASKMLAMAQELLDTMNSPNIQMDTIQ